MEEADAWRKRLNRAVREFAARSETEAAESSVLTLLREVADTLAVTRAAFVRVPVMPDGVSDCYEWGGSRTEPCLEGESVRALIADVTGSGDALVLPQPSDDGVDTAADAYAALRASGVASAVIVPTGMGRPLPWTWVLGTADQDYVWTDPVIDHLQILADVVAGILERARTISESGEQRAPAASQRPQRRSVPRVPPLSRRFEDIIGQSPALHTALSMLEEVIETNSTVLLLGETGTGKELFARALHKGGPRRAFPLVSVNCGALPPSLIESELFGHQRGAFTGAIAPRKGRFELAHRGTLFLDEIGDLALELQAKLLRVLQEGAFERVGSSQTQSVDVRIIAATHRDLEQAVVEGRFRADLYYRLNVFPIRVPTLRERREDLPALVWHIIEKRQAQFHRHITHVPSAVWDALQRYSWPGNIRELENVIEGALIHSTTHALTLREGALASATPPPDTDTRLTAVDRVHIERVLKECDWRINGAGNAAERLGLHPNTLRFRIKKLGIVRERGRIQPLRFSSGGRDRAS